MSKKRIMCICSFISIISLVISPLSILSVIMTVPVKENQPIDSETFIVETFEDYLVNIDKNEIPVTSQGWIQEVYDIPLTDKKDSIIEKESETSKEMLENVSEEIPEPEEIIPPEILYECKWEDFELTEAEFDLLCRTVYYESGGEPYDGQLAVAWVILNRLTSKKFSNDLRTVIYAKGAFSVTRRDDFEISKYGETTVSAVLEALEHNDVHPRDMYYFRNAHYHKFGHPYKKIGKIYFSTFEEYKE